MSKRVLPESTESPGSRTIKDGYGSPSSQLLLLPFRTCKSFWPGRHPTDWASHPRPRDGSVFSESSQSRQAARFQVRSVQVCLWVFRVEWAHHEWEVSQEMRRVFYGIVRCCLSCGETRDWSTTIELFFVPCKHFPAIPSREHFSLQFLCLSSPPNHRLSDLSTKALYHGRCLKMPLKKVSVPWLWNVAFAFFAWLAC